MPSLPQRAAATPSLTDILEHLIQDIQAGRTAIPPAPQRYRGGNPPPGAPEKADIVGMNHAIAQFQQICAILASNPSLEILVDRYIGQHFARTQREQQRKAIGIAVISTIAGACLGVLLSMLVARLHLM